MVTKGNTVQFTVIVENEPGNEKVVWSCNKGTISDTGRYTAPFEPGPVQIAAVRKDNGARQTWDAGLMDPPSISFFRATPILVQPGGTSTLTCLSTPDRGTVTPGGQLINSFTPVVVSPVTTTTYKVTVYNPDGAAVTAEVVVTVQN